VAEPDLHLNQQNGPDLMVRAVLRLVARARSGADQVVGVRREVGREYVVADIANQAGKAGEKGHQEQESGHGSNHALIEFLPRVAEKTQCIDFLPELI
jgi:hypothetical protein